MASRNGKKQGTHSRLEPSEGAGRAKTFMLAASFSGWTFEFGSRQRIPECCFRTSQGCWCFVKAATGNRVLGLQRIQQASQAERGACAQIGPTSGTWEDADQGAPWEVDGPGDRRRLTQGVIWFDQLILQVQKLKLADRK